MIRVVSHEDGAALLAQAGSFLLEHEVEHALMTAVALTPGATLLTVARDESTIGVAVRTPPMQLLLSRVAEADRAETMDALASYLEGQALPGVVGPAGVPEAFAARWGGPSFLRLRLREHALTSVTWPAAVRGAHRLATVDDLDRLCVFANAFVDETGLPEEDRIHATRASLEGRVAGGKLHVWVDEGEVVAMASAGGTARVGRIGLVYTPKERRRSGYASALVATLAAAALERGCVAASLSTDVKNPTSNRIYRAIGFEPIGDTVMMGFGAG